MRLLGECVHNGGYNVASEILSFLSPAHLPVQITPTRWKSKKQLLELVKQQEVKIEQQATEIKMLKAQVVAIQNLK